MKRHNLYLYAAVTGIFLLLVAAVFLFLDGRGDLAVAAGAVSVMGAAAAARGRTAAQAAAAEEKTAAAAEADAKALASLDDAVEALEKAKAQTHEAGIGVPEITPEAKLEDLRKLHEEETA